MSTTLKLLEPIKVGSKIFKNRMVMAPMEARLNTPEGGVTQAMIDYYAERAKGGAAAIIVENTFVDSEASRSSLVSSGLYSDHLIAGKNLLAEAIQENGAVAIIQLSHGGRQANAAATGKPCVAPSAIPCQVTQRMPHALTLEEIEKVEDAFAEAARRARDAGFDGVELHGAHGYLMSSFLSPYANKREDIYGGSLENRSRFARNIIRKVREKVGRSFIVGIRISGAEFVPGGLSIEEACAFARMIEKDVDYIHVSVGNYENMSEWMITPMYYPPAKLVDLAGEVKKCVGIPVITVGAMDVRLGEEALQEGKADLVAFGRALIADPELPAKVAQGRLEDIRPCCRGNEGCISRFFRGCAIRCEVNPSCGREKEYEIKKTADPKRVLVVGGGPAGLEAARVAALLGHDVTLMEKSDRLGGHLVEGSVSGFKAKTAQLLDWQKRQVESAGVKVMLNTEGTQEAVKKLAPDVLILAVGSNYQLPRFPGVDHALLPDDTLTHLDSVGSHVVVVGGGFIGAETALTLAEDGRHVTIVEMLDEIVPEHEPLSREALIKRLLDAGVEIMAGNTVKAISEKEVVCEDKAGGRHTLAADTIILATGLSADSSAVEKLQGLVPRTMVIGDCREARKVYNSMHEAWHAAFSI